MKTVSISGSQRENLGKKAAKAVRRDGDVPCVIYGGTEQVHFTTSAKSFKNIIYTPEVSFIEITIGDKVYKAILQAVQFHPVSDNIYHVDFLELVEGKPVTMRIPVLPEGSAKGVLNGGRLVQRTKTLKLKGLAEFVPENIVVDVSDLRIGQSIKVKDLDVPNVELLEYPNTNVLAVKTTRTGTADEDEEDAEGAEGEGEDAPATEE